jgi:hypothetical protein
MDDYCFRYIYDCGSSNAQSVIKSAVESYVASLEKGNDKPKVDALFISHFHEDHIKGLSTLLDHVTVQKVIIPYISSWDLLFLWAEAKSAKKYEVNEYWSFLRDPHGWFISKDVKAVLVSIPSDEAGQDSAPQELNNSPSIQPAMVRDGVDDPLAKTGTTHFHYKNPLQVKMPGMPNACWIALTHVQKNEEVMSKFKDCVSKKLGISVTDDKATQDICKELASDCMEECNVQKLKACYQEALKNGAFR